MFEKIIKELKKEERGYARNAKSSEPSMVEFWKGCANGVGRAIEIIEYLLKEAK